MRTGILVHGCNLNIENWRHVAWGDAPNLLGRIPQGLLVALQFEAEVIIFGTGASSREFRLGESGSSSGKLLEAEYSLEYLRQNFDSLKKFQAFNNEFLNCQNQRDWACLKEQLLSRIVLDVKSQNTVEEIKSASNVFLKQDIEQVVLVSSPSHIVRCLRDATSVFCEDNRLSKLRNFLYACPSTTCYEGTTPADVVVVEPPHRPDRHVVPTHRRIQRMMTLQKLEHHDLIQLIEEFDDLLQRYEHKYFNDLPRSLESE